MAELALAVVGLAVAVPTIIEPTVRSIRFIRETLHKYKATDSIQSRLILQLDLHLVQIENLTIFIYGTTSNRTATSSLAATLDPTSQAVLRRVVYTLNCLVDDFAQQLSTALNFSGSRVTGRVRRLTFAFRGRNDPLHQLLQELESWERSFSNVVFSACLAAGRRLPVGLGRFPEIATDAEMHLHTSQSSSPSSPENSTHAKDLIELVQNCLLPNKSASSTPLRLSPRSIDGCVQLAHSGLLFYFDRDSEDGSFFLEKHDPDCNPSNTEAQTRKIAAFLHEANPKLVALLSCQGFYVEIEECWLYNQDGSSLSLPELTAHTLVFHVPRGLVAPRSLRDVLLEARAVGVKHPLDERLMLMKKLASALLFIHTAEHIHKSIRADNVILLQDKDGDKEQFYVSKLGEPFLVGFDLSRQEAQYSDMTETVDLYKTYYLPVDRQGSPTRRYSMLDDIYSLGVLFIEIALWQSLVLFEPVDDLTEENGQWKGTNLLLGHGDQPLNPQGIHKRLVDLAYEEVSQQMGTVISGLIVSCLTCLDIKEGEEGIEWTSFGKRDDLADKDGIVLGQAYIRQVIMVLDMVSF